MTIKVAHLSKRFGSVSALRDVTFEVNPGEIFGLFGANGAGKTTCIRIMNGLTEPDAGTVDICGVDVLKFPHSVREKTSLMMDRHSEYGPMKLRHYFTFFGRMSEIPSVKLENEINRVVKLVGLETKMDATLQTLSTGQRQRVEVARVLMKPSNVIFLDEPFNGLDLELRKRLTVHIRSLASGGKTILFTSHNLLEAEKIVDRFAFLSQGRITAMGSAQDLVSKYLKPRLRLVVGDEARATALMKEMKFIKEVSLSDGHIVTLESKIDIPTLVNRLVHAGIEVFELQNIGNIEDVFEKVTGSNGEVDSGE